MQMTLAHGRMACHVDVLHTQWTGNGPHPLLIIAITHSADCHENAQGIVCYLTSIPMQLGLSYLAMQDTKC